MLLKSLLDQQVLFFGGKGGVGKTTCSAAFALIAAERGKRVLLVSTDPAHSTSDVFEKPIGPVERELLPRLTALEIDGDDEARRYIDAVKRDIERMFSPGIVREAERQIGMAAASPGLVEVALLDRIVDLIVDRERAFDIIVFDTAPTGHTLQLLRMPDAINTWIQALVRHRRAVMEIDRGLEHPSQPAPDDDPVLLALERRRERLGRLRAVLADRRRTSFVLVMAPERLVIEETARAAALLHDTGIDVGGVIVNRVLPEGLPGAFFEARKAQERERLREIDQRFERLPRVRVLQLPKDVHGAESLAEVARQLVP